MTSVRVCVLSLVMYDNSLSSATGSFQNQCSVASQTDPSHSPNEARSSGASLRPILNI